MTKSKIIFGVIAVCIVALCIILYFSMGSKDDPTASTVPEETVGTELEETSPITIPEDVPQKPLDVDPTQPAIYLDENVRIVKVDKDPNEEIVTDPFVGPSHPEFLDGEESSPLLSAEGSIYRNDTEISIDLVDQQTGDLYTFTFGYITGKCNRFLYLNPQFTLNGKKAENNIYFKFDDPYGGGVIETYGIDVEENIDSKACLNYSFYRAFEEREVAGYVDAKNPGTFWFSQEPLDQNIYIDVKAYYYQGGLFATLRLTIAKNEDGTYSIMDLDNKDMLTNGDNDVYSKRELAYVVELTDTTYHTPGAVHAYNSLQLEWVLNVEDCLIELRDAETGLYFNQFIPAPGDDSTDITKTYTDSQIPVLAVTYRWKGLLAQTMYFWVIEEPTQNEHGTYQFIGYDYPLLQELQHLENYGYTGNG